MRVQRLGCSPTRTGDRPLGVTYDIIPILGGESTDNAVARIWGGNPDLDDPPPPEPVDPALSAAFRDAVLRRITAMGQWNHKSTDLGQVFWMDDYGWQVEVSEHAITLRTYGRTTDRALVERDRELLEIFRDLDCVLVYDNAAGWVRLRDEPSLSRLA